MKYLKLTFFPKTQKEMDIIADNLLTSLDRDPVITENGDCFIEVFNDTEMIHEAFVLGIAFRDLETIYNMQETFMIEVVELDVAPIDTVDGDDND